MTAGCGTDPVKPDPCAGWTVICPSRLDVLTDGTSKQILGHDEHGSHIGCWTKQACKPAKPAAAKP
jgi:hypothetical protein